MVRRADPETIAKCRAMLDELKKRPPGEMIAEMIALGIIDERGRVLYGGKPSTKGKKPAKKKIPAAKKPTNGKTSNGKHS